MCLGFKCSCYSGFGWVRGTHRYAVLIRGGIQLRSTAWAFALACAYQTKLQSSASSKWNCFSGCAQHPSKNRTISLSGLCQGSNSLSQPAPGGWCCKQSSRRHPALGLCGLGKVFALLRCLGFIPTPGPVWDKQSVGSGGAHNPLSIPAATELREHLRQWKWVARIWGVFSKWFYNKLRR